MVLVDTSVWLDHLRVSDPRMHHLLATDQVLMHPFVFGEISLGSLRGRQKLLAELNKLPQSTEAHTGEVQTLIETQHLYSSGLGYLDVHLLAAALLMDEPRFWTRDKRLRDVARKLRVAYEPQVV